MLGDFNRQESHISDGFQLTSCNGVDTRLLVWGCDDGQSRERTSKTRTAAHESYRLASLNTRLYAILQIGDIAQQRAVSPSTRTLLRLPLLQLGGSVIAAVLDAFWVIQRLVLDPPPSLSRHEDAARPPIPLLCTAALSGH